MSCPTSRRLAARSWPSAQGGAVRFPHVSVKLEGGEADIAVESSPREVGSLRRQKLYVDPYVSVVRRDHPRLDRLSRPDDLLRERHIMVTASSTGHAAHEQLERVMMSKLNPDLVYVRVPSFVTSAFVASRTDAVCTLPTKLASYLVEESSSGRA